VDRHGSFWGAQAASLLSQSGSDFRQVAETIFSESNFAFGDFFARKLSSSSGGKGIRTPDFQLAKLALYQLSYAPARMEDGRWKMRLQFPQALARRMATKLSWFVSLLN